MPVSFDMGIVVYGLHPGRRSPAEQFVSANVGRVVPEDYLVRVNDRPGRRPIVTLHSWPPQPNDRPGRRPIVTLHSWQPGRLTPTHILLAGLTAQALAGQSRLYRI